MNTSWILLLTAGAFQILFSAALKLSQNFTHIPWGVAACLGALASFGCFTLSLRQIPLGVAYAVWSAVGVIGTSAVGMILFQESAGPTKIALLVVLVGSVVGLHLIG